MKTFALDCDVNGIVLMQRSMTTVTKQDTKPSCRAYHRLIRYFITISGYGTIDYHCDSFDILKPMKPVLFAVLWISLSLLILQGQTPTNPIPFSANGCSLQTTQTGQIILTCPNLPQVVPTEPKKRWYAVCQTKVLNVPTLVAFDPSGSELTLIDKDKLVVAMTPTNGNSVNVDPWQAYNLPWQTLLPAVVSRSQWEALPVEKRWGLVKGQPPIAYSRLTVTGACMTRLLEILELKSEEPL